MIRSILMTAALAFSCIASAGTAFNYTPTATGFITDSDDSVEYVNVANYGASGYKVTLSIDGVVYQGFTPASGVQFTASNSDGGYALVTATWVTTVTVSHSGRGAGARITRYFPGSGAVSVS